MSLTHILTITDQTGRRNPVGEHNTHTHTSCHTSTQRVYYYIIILCVYDDYAVLYNRRNFNLWPTVLISDTQTSLSRQVMYVNVLVTHKPAITFIAAKITPT